MATRIIYKDIAVGADEDAAVTTSDAQSCSTPSLIPFAHTMPKLAILCPRGWLLDREHAAIDGQDIPFLSKLLSDAAGAFTTAPKLHFIFDNNYITTGILLVFSPLSGDYCTSVTIVWYQGTTQLASETFTPTGTSYFCAKNVTAFNNIVISFNATSRPQHYVMLSQVIFGIVREFGLNEMDSAKMTQEINPISIEMAANALDWTLRSAEDVDYIFQKKQPLESYDDTGLVGICYIDKSKQRNTGLYDINSVDAVAELANDDFAATMFTGQTAAVVLANILGDAYTLEIDSTLGATQIYGLIPDCKRREALRMVAFRLMAAVDTSRSRTVRVFRLDITSDPDVLEKADIYAGGSVETVDIVTQVKLTAHTYTAGTSGDDVVVVGGVSYIHTTTVITLDNPNASASDLPNVKPIEDQTLIDASCASTVAAAVLAYYERRSTMKVSIILNGHKPGDRVKVQTQWGKEITGNITKLVVGLRDETTAKAEVLGE